MEGGINTEQKTDLSSSFDLLLKGSLIEVGSSSTSVGKESFSFLMIAKEVCVNGETRIVGGYLVLRMLEGIISQRTQSGDLNIQALEKELGFKLNEVLDIFQESKQFQGKNSLDKLRLRLNDLMMNVLIGLLSYPPVSSALQGLPSLEYLIEMTKNTLNPLNWDIGSSSAVILERIKQITAYCEMLIPQEKIQAAKNIVQESLDKQTRPPNKK